MKFLLLGTKGALYRVLCLSMDSLTGVGRDVLCRLPGALLFFFVFSGWYSVSDYIDCRWKRPVIEP